MQQSIGDLIYFGSSELYRVKGLEFYITSDATNSKILALSTKECIIKMGNIVDAINASRGQVITNDELILYIRGRLDNEYQHVVVHLTGRRQGSISLEEAQYTLQSQELRIVYQLSQACVDSQGSPFCQSC